MPPALFLLRRVLVLSTATFVWAAAAFAAPLASPRQPEENTPLHVAALRGEADRVEALLAAGADPNARNGAGATPLHYAVMSERMVAALLAHGADPNVVSHVGFTPLLGAVSRPDSFPVVQRLIAAGADVHVHRREPRGVLGEANALAVAIMGGDARTVRLLLAHGAEVNPALGATPLMAAAVAGDLDSARDLLARGARLDTVRTLPGTALNAAFFAGRRDLARWLIEQGADPTLPARGGTTAMIWSAYHDDGDAELARLLVSRGVDVNAANDAGETVFSYALKSGGDTDLVRYLRGIGAPPPRSAEPPKSVPARTVPPAGGAREVLVRDRAQQAVDLLQRSSSAFLQNGFVRDTAKCVSCHQQALPAAAFALARTRGLSIDEAAVGNLLAAILASRADEVETARQLDRPTPGGGLTLGYDANGLSAFGYADDRMGAFSRYLLAVQQPDGSWTENVRRPPMSDGAIVFTTWTLRALQLYPPAGYESAAADAVVRARTWLGRQRAVSHNDRVFQLLGLAWSGEAPSALASLAEALLRTQRENGAWAQLPSLEGDAWATGSALVALHHAGVAPLHKDYQRGVEYLLRTQFADGSWWVRSRSWPFQPHFDARFPHGKDQWISAAGTAGATIAVLLTLAPTVDPADLPDARQLIAAWPQGTPAGIPSPLPAGPSAPPNAAGPIAFLRDIQPVLERSCVGCHGGERPKGGFRLESRDDLLRGGQSGDPAIVPGAAEASPLFLQIAGRVEDLEMPPLHRREKYPALSAEELEQFRAWIDAGAPWAEPDDGALAERH